MPRYWNAARKGYGFGAVPSLGVVGTRSPKIEIEPKSERERRAEQGPEVGPEPVLSSGAWVPQALMADW